MTPLDDEEVICEWMEPDGLQKPFTGPENKHPYRWWQWYMRLEERHVHVDLTLDRLREVEGRLTKEQWGEYISALATPGLGWDDVDPYDDECNLYDAFQYFIHASTEQKITALAKVIRSTGPQSC